MKEMDIIAQEIHDIFPKIKSGQNSDIILDNILKPDFFSHFEHYSQIYNFIHNLHRYFIEEMWLIVIGEWPGFEFHFDGIIYEIETNTYIGILNRYDNASGRKSINVKFKRICYEEKDGAKFMIGVINSQKSGETKYEYQGISIDILEGNFFLEYIFGDKKDSVIRDVQEIVRKELTDKLAELYRVGGEKYLEAKGAVEEN